MSKIISSEEELAFCLNRIEQYFIKIGKKLMKRKIQKEKANIFFDKLGQWEEMIGNKK